MVFVPCLVEHELPLEGADIEEECVPLLLTIALLTTYHGTTYYGATYYGATYYDATYYGKACCA